MLSRVAGDALNLASLGAAMTSPLAKKERMNLVMASVVGITALDTLTAMQLRRKRADAKRYSVLTREDFEQPEAGRGFPRDQEHHRQPLARGALPVLAQLREPAAVHVPPAGGAGDRPAALAGPLTPPRDTSLVGCRDHRGPAQPADRLAVAGADVTNSGGCASLRPRRARHRGAGGNRIPPARRGAGRRWPSCSAKSRNSRSPATCTASSR